MKVLSLLLLLGALLALSQADDAQNATEEPEEEGADSEEGLTEAEGTEAPEEEHAVAKRATSCPSGWTLYAYRCYLYVSTANTWAQAETYCVARGGNLASIRSLSEFSWIKSYIRSKTCSYPYTWIGITDAQQEQYWFWSDGTRVSYKSWCSSMPRRTTSYNCGILNYSSSRCWADLPCSYRYPFVCVRK